MRDSKRALVWKDAVEGKTVLVVTASETLAQRARDAFDADLVWDGERSEARERIKVLSDQYAPKGAAQAYAVCLDWYDYQSAATTPSRRLQ